MRRNQLTITYPEGDAQQLHQALLLLMRSRCLNTQHSVEKRLQRSWSDWRQSNEDNHYSAA